MDFFTDSYNRSALTPVNYSENLKSAIKSAIKSAVKSVVKSAIKGAVKHAGSATSHNKYRAFILTIRF